MTPQTAMTLYLVISTAVRIVRIATEEKSVAQAVGGTIGVTSRVVLIVTILYWGGFYGG